MHLNICFSSVKSLFLLLILLLFISKKSSAYRREAKYKRLNIENPELCSSVATKKVWLDKRDTPGLIVGQSQLNYHSIAWEKNSVCKFKVAANSHSNPDVPKWLGVFSARETGIIAVIQDLVFRRNETTNECIDYVEFRLSNGKRTQKYCGIVTTGYSMDRRFEDSSRYNSWGLGAVKSEKEVEVFIFISKEPLQEGESVELEIAFTFYADCSHENEKTLKPCSDFHHSTCISREFFNDSVVNCPFIDCVDEGGCSNNDVLSIFDDVQPYYGTKVLIGSVSFLFILFGAFVCFLWLCKKHKVLCWADEFAHPNRTQTRVIEMNENPEVSVAPSAPIPPPEEDKPPSYDSLFPSR